MKNWTHAVTGRRWLLALALFAVAVLAGCTDGEKVEVTVGEWYITAPQAPLKAGRTTFLTSNKGGLVHELEILKKDGTHQEFEVAELANLEPGSVNELVAELSPGSYEIVCTIVKKAPDGTVLNHYNLGMHTTFTVEE